MRSNAVINSNNHEQEFAYLFQIFVRHFEGLFTNKFSAKIYKKFLSLALVQKFMGLLTGMMLVI